MSDQSSSGPGRARPDDPDPTPRRPTGEAAQAFTPGSGTESMVGQAPSSESDSLGAIREVPVPEREGGGRSVRDTGDTAAGTASGPPIQTDAGRPEPAPTDDP